ncbi:MAG: spermidine synthase [Bryobacteraceae bacterium]
MILYAVTIFLSAFLLFQVQPLIAKIILPWFGGSAAVWTAALLFFQISLLAGYAYAHALTRFAKAKGQMILHGVLLVGSCAVLPILPDPSWKPTTIGDPTLRILGLLAATIGLPYFLLSSTSPLLQAWYVRRTGSTVPYRLFALSNFGSMLALLSFPFVVEPLLPSRQQAYIWSGVYVAFAALCLTAAFVSRRESEPAAETKTSPAAGGARPTASQLLLWVSLAACASTLLISVTNHLSQNVAPIPLLWVVPLAIYLATFILAFESDSVYQRWIFLPWVAPALGWMAWAIYSNEGNLHIKWAIPIFAVGLFICCMMCHGELARRKPSPQYLTLFYLMVSLGGALGGVFVALIAPRLFKTFLELPIGLTACGILAVIVLWDLDMPRLNVWTVRLGLFVLTCGAAYLAYQQYQDLEGVRRFLPVALVAVGLYALVTYWKSELPAGPWLIRFTLAIGVGLLAGYLGRMELQDRKGYHLMVRNFYGALRVRDDDVGEESATRNLLHGTINHGSERLAPGHEYDILSYYSPNSGIGRAMGALQAKGPVRYGVVGLGAGVMSGYARAGDYLRIYEINPLVPTIAQTEFKFFPHSAADKKILMGDARLTMEAQEPQNYDVLVVDAFSSDAIPVHLLTREAMKLYFTLLKPNGVLAVHISNRYLDLAPVCARGAAFVGRKGVVVTDDGGDYANSTTWVLITSDESIYQEPAFVGANMFPASAADKFRGWTDDYSNIVSIISWN